jgi:hypothetical protein
MQSYRSQSRDAIERIGITIWKIAVLVIGLHCSPQLFIAHSNPWSVLRGSEWMVALGLEGMLAAQIIQVSMAYVGQNELSWSRIGMLMIVALSRVLI